MLFFLGSDSRPPFFSFYRVECHWGCWLDICNGFQFRVPAANSCLLYPLLSVCNDLSKTTSALRTLLYHCCLKRNVASLSAAWGAPFSSVFFMSLLGSLLCRAPFHGELPFPGLCVSDHNDPMPWMIFQNDLVFPGKILLVLPSPLFGFSSANIYWGCSMRYMLGIQNSWRQPFFQGVNSIRRQVHKYLLIFLSARVGC